MRTHWYYHSKMPERKRSVFGVDDLALAIGIATLTGGAAAGGMAMGGMGKDEENQIQIPPFSTDPYVGKTQDQLFPFFSQIMAGNIPDYYKGIGEYGGPELEGLVNMTNRDVTNAVTEDLARRNVTGGLGTDVIARATADKGTQLRWNDFLRAMSGRQWLGSWGTTGMENVRSGALTNQGQINQYNLGKAGLDLNVANMENTQQAQENAMWSNILSSGVGTLGNLYGMNMLKDIYTPKVASNTLELGNAGYPSFSSISKNYDYNPDELKWADILNNYKM